MRFYRGQQLIFVSFASPLLKCILWCYRSKIRYFLQKTGVWNNKVFLTFQEKPFNGGRFCRLERWNAEQQETFRLTPIYAIHCIQHYTQQGAICICNLFFYILMFHCSNPTIMPMNKGFFSGTSKKSCRSGRSTPHMLKPHCPTVLFAAWHPLPLNAFRA